MKHALARKFLKVIVVLSFLLLLCTEIFIFNTFGWSQSGSEASAPMPTPHPFVPPALSYSSAFKNYHGYQDQEVASWLEANETVGRIGGWRYYLEEAQPQQEPIPLTEDARHHSGHGGKP